MQSVSVTIEFFLAQPKVLSITLEQRLKELGKILILVLQKVVHGRKFV